MVKQNFLTKMLLLCALIVGSVSSVWAEDVTTTYYFVTDRNWKATCDGEEADWISNVRANGYTDNQGIQITSSSSGANATSPISFTNVKKIVVTYCTNTKAGKGTIKVKVGSGTEKTFSVTAPSSGGTTLKTTEFTFSPVETGAVTLTVDCTTNSIYIYSIAITWENSSSAVATTTAIDDSGITNTDVYKGIAAGSLSATVTVDETIIDGASVTWSSSDENVATIGSDGAVTLVAAGTTTITASYAGEENQYQASSATYELEVTNSNPNAIQEAWVLTNLADLTANDVFVIVGNNGSNYAMLNSNGTGSAPSAVAVTVSDGKITGTVADNIKWNISGNATDGYTFYPDGSTTTWLYCTNTNNGVRVGTGVAKHFTLSSVGYLTTTETEEQRYLGIYNSSDWRSYKKETEANIKDQTFNFYKKVSFVALSPAKTYTTLTSAYNLDFTGLSLKAYIVLDEDASDGKVTMTQVNKVPAGTGLVVKAETPGASVEVPVFDGTQADDVEGNKMQGSATETTAIAENAGYILKDGAFHPSSGNGVLAAGKAYLAIAVNVNAPALSMDFGEGTTDIQNIERTMNDNQYYTLDGRRVAQPTKGLYIVNGKKVLVP